MVDRHATYGREIYSGACWGVAAVGLGLVIRSKFRSEGETCADLKLSAGCRRLCNRPELRSIDETIRRPEVRMI